MNKPIIFKLDDETREILETFQQEGESLNLTARRLLIGALEPFKDKSKELTGIDVKARLESLEKQVLFLMRSLEVRIGAKVIVKDSNPVHKGVIGRVESIHDDKVVLRSRNRTLTVPFNDVQLM